MNVLIIEDEPFAQKELIRILNQCDPSVRVLKCIDSIEESIKWLKENDSAELIFMDIQLSDGISFEIFNHIQVKTPVIFTTAYDEYAIKAFKVNSIDYLLKPIEETDLCNSLQKFRDLKDQFERKNQALSESQLKEVIGLIKPTFKQRLITKLGDRIYYIETKDIAYIYSEEKVTFMITKENKRYMLNYTLEQVEKLLDPARFYRLNRKYLTHIDAIGTINKYFNSRLKVQLNPEVDDEILVSRARVSDFMDWLEK